MIRKEQLKQCRICQHRLPSKQGLLCSLTNTKAVFTGRCTNYQLDKQEQDKRYIASRTAEKQALAKLHKTSLILLVFGSSILIHYFFGQYIFICLALIFFSISMYFLKVLVAFLILLIGFILIYTQKQHQNS